MRDLMSVFIALMAAYYFAVPAQDFYCANIGTCTGGFFGFDLGVLIWMVLIYAFSVTALLTTFGGKHKYWWVGITLTPSFLFQVTVDLYHIHLLIIWSLIAWGLGKLANSILHKTAPSFMAKLK